MKNPTPTHMMFLGFLRLLGFLNSESKNTKNTNNTTNACKRESGVLAVEAFHISTAPHRETVTSQGGAALREKDTRISLGETLLGGKNAKGSTVKKDVVGHLNHPPTTPPSRPSGKATQPRAAVRFKATRKRSGKLTYTSGQRRSSEGIRDLASAAGSLWGLTATIRAGATIVMPPFPVAVPELDRLACPLTRNAARCW